MWCNRHSPSLVHNSNTATPLIKVHMQQEQAHKVTQEVDLITTVEILVTSDTTGLKDCPASQKLCHKCGKVKRYAWVCRSSERAQQIAQVNNSVHSANSSYVYKRDNKRLHHSPYFNVLIGGSNLSMMADSGASVNILTDINYNRLQSPSSLPQSAVSIYAHRERKLQPTDNEFVTSLQ